MTGGPECPRCGCNDTKLIAAGGGGKLFARFECDYCKHVITIGGVIHRQKAVDFSRVCCPACGGRKTHVASSRSPRENNRVRMHKCDECGHSFKSVER